MPVLRLTNGKKRILLSLPRMREYKWLLIVGKFKTQALLLVRYLSAT